MIQRMRTLTIALVLGLSSAALAAPKATSSNGLRFIENDYAKALKAAKSTGLPIFADVWAPW